MSSKAAREKKEREAASRERRESKIGKDTSMEAEHEPNVGLENEFRKFRDEMRGLIKELDDNICKKLGKLDSKFSNMFQDLKDEMGSMKSDVQAATSDIQSMSDKLDDYETSLEFQSQRISDLEKTQDDKLDQKEKALQDKIDSLDRKLMLLEKQDRKYNLLFYGIPEETGEKLYTKMRQFFVSELKIDAEAAQRIYFVHGHRFPTESEGPKPIIIRFSSFDDRELILSHAKNLLKTKKRILIDLPVVMKRERGRLAKIAFEIRKTEKLQTRIKDKGLDLYIEVRKERADTWVKRQL